MARSFPNFPGRFWFDLSKDFFIYFRSAQPAKAAVHMDGCKDQTSHSLAVLEHVVCKVTLKHNPRGSLHLVLISPMGTRSSLLLPRLYILGLL